MTTTTTGTIVVYRSPRDGSRWVGVATGDLDDVGTEDERHHLTDVITFDDFGRHVAEYPGGEVTTADVEDDPYYVGLYAARIRARMDHVDDERRKLYDEACHLDRILAACRTITERDAEEV